MLNDKGKPYPYGIIWCSDKKGDLEVCWFSTKTDQLHFAKLKAQDKDTLWEVALFTVTEHITAKPKSWVYTIKNVIKCL